MREKITRQAILQVSEEIVNQEGYESLTLAKLAKALKIKTPSLYNHISNLNDLRNELAVHALKQLSHQIMMSAVGKAGDVALKSIGLADIHFMSENPGLYDAMLRAPDPQNEEIEKISSEIISMLLRVLEPYHLSEENAIHIIRGLRALSHGFNTLERRGGFNMNVPLEDSISVAFDTFIKGMITTLKK
ncbi:TetR/AcrR family transcriptional regulator [Sporolactobacillus laevolacticus]|uniref:TetR/AcrR family transcriptional regulator n=1 Tax=Sporolactobacillus laevolacticus TaxID=33018 RepID=UPI0025B4D965|nr:TetR/AcrR family transcriptional regulator [Sporolactobacillus laevolacticus]MDN3956389.1 WHG domain-containing protein [Sporolactobacillus laevolacticus]